MERCRFLALAALAVCVGCESGPSSDDSIEASGKNLKKIAEALMNYEYDLDGFPPQHITTSQGKPGLSWRVELLPHLGMEELYREFRLDEPWDSANNRKLLGKMPDVYRSPRGAAGGGKTHYLAVAGEKGVIAGPRRATMASISDGTSNTMLVVEVGDELATPWTQPEDYTWSPGAEASGLGFGNDAPLLCILADGSVQLLPANIAVADLAGTFTRNGKELATGINNLLPEYGSHDPRSRGPSRRADFDRSR